MNSSPFIAGNKLIQILFLTGNSLTYFTVASWV